MATPSPFLFSPRLEVLPQPQRDLAMALAAGAAVYGRQFNPQITLKALAYFGDGNLREVPAQTRAVLVEAVRGVDPLRLPALRPIAPRRTMGHASDGGMGP